jgi:hypothetical protein
MSQARNQQAAAPRSEGEHIPPKRLMIFNGLHGIISQKIELSSNILMNGGYFIDLSCFCFVYYKGYLESNIHLF